MLSHFAGGGQGAEEVGVATLEPESTPWPLQKHNVVDFPHLETTIITMSEGSHEASQTLGNYE